MIGIFWIHKKSIFGKAILLDQGEDSGAGFIDSPDNHNDLWDRDLEFRRLYPELRHREYFEIPRGRVLYSISDKQSVVYMDKVLFNESTKRLVAGFFQLDPEKTSWRTDEHYTTDPSELNRLFAEF